MPNNNNPYQWKVHLIYFSAVSKELPIERCGLSCIGSPVVWVTVVSVVKAEGLSTAKQVFCALKCEGQKAKTSIGKVVNDQVEWNDPLVFYRRTPEKPIFVKVLNFFLRIPDQYYRVECRYQDGACRTKPLARRGNSWLNHNSLVYYRESGLPITDVLILIIELALT